MFDEPHAFYTRSVCAIRVECSTVGILVTNSLTPPGLASPGVPLPGLWIAHLGWPPPQICRDFLIRNVASLWGRIFACFCVLQRFFFFARIKLGGDPTPVPAGKSDSGAGARDLKRELASSLSESNFRGGGGRHDSLCNFLKFEQVFLNVLNLCGNPNGSLNPKESETRVVLFESLLEGLISRCSHWGVIFVIFS